MVANEKPNYYAIITAEVRYDKSLEYWARLLFAEITALSNKTGECFASNEYFSDIFEISEKTVRRWKQSLESNGYIYWDKKTGKVSIIDNFNPSRGTKMSGGGDKNVRGGGQKCPSPTYSIINNKLNINSYYSSEEEKEQKIEENGNAEKIPDNCTEVSDVLSCVRESIIMDEFWYKLWSRDDLANAISEMLYHYESNGKKVPKKLAETRLRSWLKPRYETEEDRDEMKKAKKRAEIRAERSKGYIVSENDKKIDTGAKKIDYESIPEDFRNEKYKKFFDDMRKENKYAIVFASNTKRFEDLVRAKVMLEWRKNLTENY